MREKINNFIYLLIGSYLLLTVNTFAEKDTIEWIKADIPPYYIEYGKYKNEGIADKIIEILKANLTEYDHKDVLDIPVSRIEGMLKSERHVCFVTTLKNINRENYMYFSNETIINPQQRIIAKKNKISLITTKKSISLDRLMENKEFKIGIADRSYGNTIDSILKENEGNENIYKRTGADVVLGLIKMLDNGRLDYIIGTPYEINYAAEVYGNRFDLISIGIDETANEGYLYSYAAVPKNKWGEKLKNEINQILYKQRKTDEYFSVFERWLDEKSSETLRKDWKTVITN